jgi:ABC-type glycerol-3-phosphate transport system substrate-binding protein
MKRKPKLPALLLAAVLLLSLLSALTGCHGNEPSPGPGNSPAPTEGTTAAPAPDDFVYQTEYIPVAEEIGSFSRMACGNGGFLCACWEKSGDPEGEAPESGSRDEVYAMKLYFIGLDGSVLSLERYRPLETGEGDTTYIVSLALSPEGKPVSLELLYRSAYDGPEDAELYSDEWYEKRYYNYLHTEQIYFLRFLEDNGAEEKRIELTDPLAEGLGNNWANSYELGGFVLDGSGQVWLSAGETVVALDAGGGFRGLAEASDWIDKLICLQDGRIGAVYGKRFTLLDRETLEMDETQSFPLADAHDPTAGGGDYDLYYTSGSNFMGYDLETGRTEKILNWLNADVIASHPSAFFVLEDGRIAALDTDLNPETGQRHTTLLLIGKVPASGLARKTVVTLATVMLSAPLRRMVVEFNRTNPDVRIEVRDYSEYNTKEDRTAGLSRLNAEIAEGNVPDILDLSGFPIEKLAAKGMLEDLTPYLEADPELSGQLIDSVLNSLKTGGRLYRAVPGFAIATVVGARSVVGDRPGWTLEEFNDALKTMPASCEPFGQNTTRRFILSLCLGMELNRLADWSTGLCAFDTPLFTDILAFAERFPKEIDWESIQREDDAERIAAGRQMLLILGVSDFLNYRSFAALFGSEATFIGFPTAEGTGNMFVFNNPGLAICAESENKEAAWRFLRAMLTAAYQEQYATELPLNRLAFEAKLRGAMTPEYQTDADGSYLLDENGERIERDKAAFVWGSQEIHIRAMTQEQADQLAELIETTTKVQNYDEAILTMIANEAEAYFYGQKTAEEVGRLLQSKITIYLSEQK